MPSAINDHPVVVDPMLDPVVMKLLSDLIPAQAVFRPIVIERVIMVFGPYDYLDSSRGESGWIGGYAEQFVGVSRTARPGVGGD